ncbi:MAG TPA: hypothetical protein RMI62_06800, partial [Polyangiaceae bacterium LLY-WYZ-15_(1-7)]|nr:hypothetical protein [Polyangiaceae bacterium LLY-WYZ-15_(1-7)]
CASCADGSALDGQLAGFEAGAALTEVLGWADARGVARVGVARTAAGERIAQALDLELGFGAAVPLSERGEVVLTGGTGDVQAQLVDVAPGEGGAITATARDLPAGSLGFGDVKLLPTTSEPITEVYDALPLRAGDVQGVAALAGLPGGGLLLDVSSVGVESRRYASLGAWNADTPWARFALVRLRGIGVAQPTVGDLGALVLVGDPASGRYQLQILTLPIVGEPTLLARLEITDAPTPDEGWLVPEPSAQLALGDPDGDGDVDLLVLLGFGREARLVVFELTGDDWAPRAHPLPALPLRAAFERCGDGSCRREAARRSGGFDEDADLIATPDLAALRVPVGGSVEGVGEIGLAAELRVPARGGDAEWNAVDATAQEGSDGRYPMGPDDADGDGVPDGRRTWVEQEARSAAPRVLAEAPMGTVGATVAALGAPEGGRLDVLANGRLQWSIARADDAPGAAPALPLEAGELLRGLPTPLGRATFLVETRQIEDGAVFRQVVRRSGDRVERGRRDPSVWFYPGSTRLRAIGPCGDGCPDGQEVSWVDEEGVLQLGRIDPGSVAVALAGEGPLALVEGSTVALGAAPTGADLGLDVLPGTLAETTRPQRVSTWALPFATDPEDPPAPPGRPV